ncbi:MAG: hypothetical protein MR695_06540 [Solobacterium sp.]|nr:hypothetical protein [Solobacterium sp.]
MALLTKEKLQERLRQSRERQDKKRQAEKERRRAIKQEVLAELKKPKKMKLIKLDGYKKESSNENLHYSVDTESSLISNILLGDLYETREELMEAEKRGEGKLNWDYFDSAVKRVRDLLK